jgi:hypothetical protein
VPPKFNILKILQWANLIGPLQKKVETMEAPQSRRFYGKMECLPLWPTYIYVWEGEDFGQNKWEVLLGTTLTNPFGNLKGNMLGTNEKRKEILPTPHPKLKRKKKKKALWVHAEPSHWLHEISMFQNCLSPFFAWANTPHYKLGVLILLWLILISCGGSLEVQFIYFSLL